MKKTLLIYLSFILLSSLVSCRQTNDSVHVTDVPAETICTIDGQLDRLNSIAVIDKEKFVLCTETQVYVYNSKGIRLYNVGNQGRAKYEYSMPLYVRTDGSKIYVWDAMMCKIITYSIDGRPIEEYSYDSSMNDFMPFNNNLLIYAGGRHDNHIIEIYDLSKKEVVSSFGDPTIAHQTLKWLSVCPMSTDEGKIYFMPKDKLTLMSFNPNDESTLTLENTIESDSFVVRQLETRLQGEERSKYLEENSFVVLLVNKRGNWYTLTSEGTYSNTTSDVDRKDRLINVYKLSKNGGKKLLAFPSKSFSYSNLLSVFDGNVYYIHHKIVDEEDVYSLNKLVIGN